MELHKLKTEVYNISIPQSYNKMKCLFCAKPSEAITKRVEVNAQVEGQYETVRGTLVFTDELLPLA